MRRRRGPGGQLWAYRGHTHTNVIRGTGREDKEVRATGLGGIKPGSRVGGKEGHQERKSPLARRRQKNKGMKDRAWKPTGESKGGRRGKEERLVPGQGFSPHRGLGVSPPLGLRGGAQPSRLRRHALHRRKDGTPQLKEWACACQPAMDEPLLPALATRRTAKLPSAETGAAARRIRRENVEGSCVCPD